MKWLAIILLFLTSCSGKPDMDAVPEEPADLINQEKFTQVMLDMQLLEATLKLKLIRKEDIKSRTPGFYTQIFEKHAITQTSFTESLDFYAKQGALIAQIYDSVEVRLIRLKDDSGFRDKKETPGKKQPNS